MAVSNSPTTSKKLAMRSVKCAAKVPHAKQVLITGEFCEWSPEGVRMTRNADGEWHVVLQLAPGEYQYRLKVDGEWQDHAEAEKKIANPFGTENCVLVVK